MGLILTHSFMVDELWMFSAMATNQSTTVSLVDRATSSIATLSGSVNVSFSKFQIITLVRVIEFPKV